MAGSAVQGGANRLEVCNNLAHGGGTTPSLGLVTAIRRVIPKDVPIMVNPISFSGAAANSLRRLWSDLEPALFSTRIPN